MSKLGLQHHDLHTAAGDLRELPISTVSLLGQNLPVGGGGYFRLLSYPLIREAIRAINRQGQPAVFYLHPYELDAEEPFGGLRATPFCLTERLANGAALVGVARRCPEPFDKLRTGLSKGS